jgi:hypothetical protein
MGSQVMEIVVWVLSIIIVSAFLGMMFQVLRGVFDGYMDRWEENYLVNKKTEYLEENILSVNDPLPGEEEIDDDWDDDDDNDYPEPNDNLRRAAERYKDVIDKTYDAARPYYGDLDEDDPLPGEEEIDGEDDPFNDPDVLDFLERADEPGPWDEQYDKSYTVGGLSADKDKDFMRFQKKMDENDEVNGKK